MSLRQRSAVLVAALLLSSVTAAQDLLVRGARVITASGPELRRGSVLIKDGKVARVARRIKAPADVPVLDCANRIVMPGFVLAQTSRGLERQNERVQVTPYVSVLDSLDPSNVFFEGSLRDGHLTILVMPGDATVIGGMGRIVRPVGLTVEEMTVVADAGMKISLVPRTNRASQLAQIRKHFDDAKRHLAKKLRDADKKPTGSTAIDLAALSVDRRKEATLRLLRGEIPAYISCGTAGDVLHALRLTKDYGLDTRLFVGPGIWRAAKMLAKHKVPVILGPTMESTETDPETGEPVTRNLPKILRDAGVSFAVTSDPSSLGGRYLWYQAACLVRYGIPRDQAIRAVTLDAARAIGLGERKGSLEAGKDGDLLVLTDDPLSGKAWVDKAIVGGRIVYDRLKDPRLAEVFGGSSK